MSFKLLLFQLGFTCITAADKLRFILSDSEDIWRSVFSGSSTILMEQTSS